MSVNLNEVFAKIISNKRCELDLVKFAGDVLNKMNESTLDVQPSEAKHELFSYTFKQKRYVTTLGRVITRQLGFDPQTYAVLVTKLTNAYRAEVRKAGLKFEIVYGADIVLAYDEEYAAHSCMTGSSSNLLGLYEYNPEVISMLKFHSPDTRARAMMWKTTDKKTILDRIYPNDGWHVEAIFDWCKENKIIYRKCLGQAGGKIATSDDKQHFVMVKPDDDEKWPYLDTFRYGRNWKEDKWLLSNYPSGFFGRKKFEAKRKFFDTGGGYEEVRVCELCGHPSEGGDSLKEILFFGAKGTAPGSSRSVCRTCLRKPHPLIKYCIGCNRQWWAPAVWKGAYCPRCIVIKTESDLRRKIDAANKERMRKERLALRKAAALATMTSTAENSTIDEDEAF